MSENPAASLASLAEGVLMDSTTGEAVLLDLNRQLYYSLDDVGTCMLEASLRMPDVDAVVAALASRYESESAILARDLCRLLGDLAERGLVDHDVTERLGPVAGAG